MIKMKPVIVLLFSIILVISCGNDKQHSHPSAKDNMSLSDTNKHPTKSVSTENISVRLAHAQGLSNYYKPKVS